MSISLYDEAIVKKIQSWINSPNLRVLRPDEVTRLFQLGNADNNDEPMKLPLISVSRVPEFNILQTNRKPISYDGLMLDATYSKSLQLNAIPISITYQVDIYTQTYREGDEYLRNFIFNLVNSPDITIFLPYNDSNIEVKATIELDTSVSDNSDIPERLFAGQFTRWTLVLHVNNAYLFSVPYKKNVHIGQTEVKTI